MIRLAYLDSSAVVKLVLDEAETDAMRRFVSEGDRFVMSRVGDVEVRRAAARRAHDSDRLSETLLKLEIVELNVALATVAARQQPGTLRTLDAIHLATAIGLAPELDAFVTYDARLAEAARLVGLPVVTPA